MKPANHAPAFALLYRGLCDIARHHGYALVIHGTLISDFDLIAVPWVGEVSPAQALIDALSLHCNACIEAYVPGYEAITQKPHGRIAVNLYLDFGAKVDLSVIPAGATR